MRQSFFDRFKAVVAVATEEGTTNNNNHIITIINSSQGRVLFSENENRAPTLIFFSVLTEPTPISRPAKMQRRRRSFSRNFPSKRSLFKNKGFANAVDYLVLKEADVGLPVPGGYITDRCYRANYASSNHSTHISGRMSEPHWFESPNDAKMHIAT